tara:strand:- start:644 stop:1120 length:477 start_codon:yes stop_codon:yes gene_type:complete
MERIPTPHGTFLAHFTVAGLARLQFPGDLPETISGSIAPKSALLKTTLAALSAALKGKAPASLPPFDLSTGTCMQQQLWRALLLIPAGRTRTYGELAKSLGRPRAARAIGQACGANPIPVLIPCHRVLAANGAIGGFSAPMEWKVNLLNWESRQAANK